MTCQEFDNLLHPFVDGEFDAQEREAAEDHLIACARCGKQVLELRTLKSTLRRGALEAAGVQPAPAALRARIEAGMRREDRRRATRRAWGFASAAAITTLVGAVAWTTWPRARDRYITDAARHHARPLPHEIAVPHPREVEAWFGGKFEHRVPVPRLKDAQIAGARISHVQERQAAYIRYRKPDGEGSFRNISVFVFGDEDNDVDAEALPELEVERRLGYNVAVWRDGEIVYELVSDLDERDIRALLSAYPSEAAPLPAPLPTSAPLAVPVRPASLQQ